MATLVTARWILTDALHLLEGGALLVEDGRIREHVPNARAVAELSASGVRERVDLGELVLTPGLVNAHAHLEWPHLDSFQAGRNEFVDWVGCLLRLGANTSPAEFDAVVERGATRLLETGTTAVGDIDSTGASTRCLGRYPLHSRVYREFLDAHDVVRAARECARLADLRLDVKGVLPGLSPHAAHTVSTQLLCACADYSSDHSVPISSHWAETEEEREWSSDGTGAFAAFLGESPHRSGFERLERAGILSGNVSLVHANRPEPGELQRAAAAGAVLVHCPGTHRYFGRPPLDLQAWLDSGATIALGTDSLASNEDLDMRLEMARLRQAHRELEPATVFEWATRGGAAALALEDLIGDLGVGKSADWVAFDLDGCGGREGILDAVTGDRPPVVGVWIAGEQV